MGEVSGAREGWGYTARVTTGHCFEMKIEMKKGADGESTKG